jgi:ribose transport system substrate-binding protein
MKLRSGLLASMALMLVFNTAARADGEVIAVFTKNLTNPFFQNERVAAEKAAKQLNATVVQYTPTKPDSIPEQLSQIEDVIVKKPSAAVFVPVDYKAMVPGVEKMNAAGIPVVNITDHLAGGTLVAFVGIDDLEVAKTTAESLMKAMGGKGTVVILEGVKGSISSQDRVKGFNEVINKYPDVKLLASQPGNFQRLNALQVMENLMQTYPQINGVLAANDAMAIGAIEALDGGQAHLDRGRHQRHQGGSRRHQGGQALVERPSRSVHAELHRHDDRDSSFAEATDQGENHP